MITHWVIPLKRYKSKHCTEANADRLTFGNASPDELLSDLKKVNIFVGPTNSGKSALLRQLFKDTEPRFISPDNDRNFPLRILEEYRASLQNIFEPLFEGLPHLRLLIPKVIDKLSISDYKPALEMKGGISSARARVETEIKNAHEIIQSYRNGNAPNASVLNRLGIDSTADNNIRNVFARIARSIDENRLSTPYFTALNELKVCDRPLEFTKHYIPTLRSLRRLPGATDVFQAIIEADYEFKSEKDKLLVHTGQTVYARIRSCLLGDLASRTLVRNLEQYLKENIFAGSDVAIIPRENPEQLYIKLGNEKEMPVHELGDGIQHILIMFGAAFLDRNGKDIFFIEEPELFLHPYLQRKCLDELCSGKAFEDAQVFLTTHSNHLLEMTADKSSVAIFRFDKNVSADGNETLPTFAISRPDDSNRELMNCLGVRPASVFLTNCQILVDGISDTVYLRRYLTLYQQSQKDRFEEDRHFSFLMYCGSLITRIHFDPKAASSPDGLAVMRALSNVFVFMDYDVKEGDVKEGEFKKWKDDLYDAIRRELKENVYRLGRCIEIENTIPAGCFPAIAKAFCKIDEPPVMPEDIASTITSERMGNLLERVTKLNKNSRRRAFAESSGTLKSSYKLEFAQCAMSHVHSFEDLCDDIKEAVKAIYDFIRQHNS